MIRICVCGDSLDLNSTIDGTLLKCIFDCQGCNHQEEIIQ